jgi:tetratricopeptide (TPR) repeat protein
MTHKEAAELVETNGGSAMASVSGQTTMLVVGDEGWPLEPDGQASQKLDFIESQLSAGHDVKVLDESAWLHLIGLADRDTFNKTYTPAMLSQLLNVSVGSIRRWERLGLIKSAKRIHRLPYFDFQEVANARRLSELLLQGVSVEQLQKSLAKVSKTLSDADRPLAQLDILVQDSELVLRDERGIMEAVSGQRLLDFDREPAKPGDDDELVPSIAFPQSEPTEDRSSWSAEEWFYEGCRLADYMEPEAAVEAFRMALMAHGDAIRSTQPGDEEPTPHPAEISFYLADALYRSGKVEAAIERYYSAVEHDPHYLEAWIQLGCLLGEQSSPNRAIEAFRIALDVHPDYPDAHLHIANTYEELADLTAARLHWAKYLEFDSRGPWAEHARQRLAGTE